MKIVDIQARPMRLAYRVPFHWAQGVIDAAEVLLVSIHTEEGIVGFGECVAPGSAEGVEHFVVEIARLWRGASAFDNTALRSIAYKSLFKARGTCSAPRFASLVLAGLDMALWDLVGKAVGRPVHELIGGAVRERVSYFGFPQGETADEIAADADRLLREGHEVIYAKIGRGDALDLKIVSRLRSTIGDRRLRLDANEAWDLAGARRMIAGLARFEIEFLEQPVFAGGLRTLAELKRGSVVPIAADQSVFTVEDVYEACLQSSADLIVLGLHEIGGILPFKAAAAIAEASGRNLCIHGVYETGITTCASNQVGASIPNLDDANQMMSQLLVEDIIETPSLALENASLPVLDGPGLGFTLNWDAIARGEEAYRKHRTLAA